MISHDVKSLLAADKILFLASGDKLVDVVRYAVGFTGGCGGQPSEPRTRWLAIHDQVEN